MKWNTNNWNACMCEKSFTFSNSASWPVIIQRYFVDSEHIILAVFPHPSNFIQIYILIQMNFEAINQYIPNNIHKVISSLYGQDFKN